MKSILAFVVIVLLIPSVSEGQTWLSTDWGYRIKVTVDADSVSSTVSDFPIFVDLGVADFAHLRSNASGITNVTVTSSDGSTELSKEVKNLGADYGQIYFKAASVDGTTDTDFYIYYGGTGNTANSTAVWSNGYEAVYHFDELPSTDGQLLDSSADARHSTSIAGSMTDGDRIAGTVTGSYAWDFDGTDDEVIIQPVNASGTSATFTFLYNTSVTANDRGFFGNNASGNVGVLTQGSVGFTKWYDSGSGGYYTPELTSNDFYDGTWRAVTVVVDAIVDTVKIINDTWSYDFATRLPTEFDVTLSGNSYLAGYWNGGGNCAVKFDEVYIADGVKTLAWIYTQHRNLLYPTDGGFFALIDTYESQPSADSPVADDGSVVLGPFDAKNTGRKKGIFN